LDVLVTLKTSFIDPFMALAKDFRKGDCEPGINCATWRDLGRVLGAISVFVTAVGLSIPDPEVVKVVMAVGGGMPGSLPDFGK
jgi:hypothetical protein